MIQPPDLTVYYILTFLPFVSGFFIGGHIFRKNKQNGIVILIVGTAMSFSLGIVIIQPIHDSYQESVLNEIQTTNCNDLQSLSKDYESLKYWHGSTFEDKIQSTYLYNCLEKSETKP